MQFYAHFPSLIHTHTHASFAKKTYEMPNEIPAEGERMPQVVACISSEVCSLPKGPNIIKTHTYVHTNIKCRKQNGAQLLPLKPVPKYQREPILLASTAMQATTYTSTTPTFVYQRWLKMKKIWVSQSKAINNACNQQWNWGEIVETKKLQRHLTLTLCGVALLPPQWPSRRLRLRQNAPRSLASFVRLLVCSLFLPAAYYEAILDFRLLNFSATFSKGFYTTFRPCFTRIRARNMLRNV